MQRTRIRIISGVILLFSLFLFAKLYILQVIHNSEFVALADKQYLQPASGVLDRGTIYFQSRMGDLIAAATLKSGGNIAIDPIILQKGDIEGTYTKLNAIIPLDHTVFLAKANKPKDTYEEIAKEVESNKMSQISALKISGVIVSKDVWRYYPGDTLAAHTIGFMSFKGDDYSGRYGLERFYNDILVRNVDNLYSNFFAEIFSNIDKTVVQGESLEGDVVTTIEPTTQAYLDNMVKSVDQQYSSQSTGAIIMNPKTGEIYAMSLYPTFDPNDLGAQSSSAVFSNDLVENVHEMGSIVKILTMAVGIDLGKVASTTTYSDPGSVTLDNYTIYNFDKKPRGITTLQTAMAQSLNVGFVYVERQIGNSNLSKYFKAFGLGKKTGIDLPNEGTGIISNLDAPRDIEYATASFGQGIAMTPIETVRALAAVANGGTMVTPHVVKRIDYRIGYSKTITEPVGARVIASSSARAVTQMLINDVDNVMLAGKAKNLHYSVAAKTGTAQIPAPTGGYYEDRVLHSFVGYLPAYNPQFIVFIYTVNPRGVQYASESLAQPFIDLTKFLINYYQIPPDR